MTTTTHAAGAAVSWDAVGPRPGPAGLGDTARAWLSLRRPAIVVTVEQARGSTPRTTGTRMLVGAEHCAGTIGGGNLEFQAIATARALLAESADPDVPRSRHTRHYALGPSLGQCCGGAVDLSFERLDSAMLACWPPTPARFHVALFGAGHVGRALVRILRTLPCSIDWIDERTDPQPGGADDPPRAGDIALVRRIAVDAAEAEVATQPPGALYLVMTHRHDLDLAICAAVLARDDSRLLGVIGSDTKRARFLNRLAERGVPPEQRDRLVCPIGLPGIAGKEPEIIALSVAAQIMQLTCDNPADASRP
jgi:xanthine dehydrogenase accessory factor